MAFFDDLKKQDVQVSLTLSEQRIIAQRIYDEITDNCLLMKKDGFNRLIVNYCWLTYGTAPDSRTFHITSNFYAGNNFVLTASRAQCSALDVDRVLEHLNRLLAADGFPAGCVRRETINAGFAPLCYCISAFIRW